MRQSLSRQLATLVCTLIVLGCTDSLAPEDVAGLYVLERIGSEALPAVRWENEHYAVWVTSGAIRLRSDGTGTLSSFEESVPWQDGHYVSELRYLAVPIRFRTPGDRIEIEFLCAPNELCAPPPHMVARRSSGGLRVRYFESPTPLHYARVVFAE